MADPFSIVAGVAGLSDLCIRFAKILKDSKDDFQKTDAVLTKLESQISTVKNIITEVRTIHDAVIDSPQGETQQAQKHHWQTTSEHLTGCMNVVGQLESLVSVVTGDKTTNRKLDKLKKYLRHQSKEGEFAALQGELQSYQSFLQIDLTASNA